MTHTVEFLHSTEAQPGRRARMNDYPNIGETLPTMVVHVETAKGMIELDADDANHAQRLIDTWIGQMKNMSAKYYSVDSKGKLIKGSRIYDFRDFQD